MNSFIRTLVVAIFVTMLLQSCIKDPPVNPEADIELFNVDNALLTGEVFIDQESSVITLNLTQNAFNNGIVPLIKVSQGASVTPESGSRITFEKDVEYVVTSASGENRKIYKVKVVNVGHWDFDFEDWSLSPSDQFEFPIESNNTQVWSSGNPGVALAGVPQRAEAYPTQSTDDGYLGSKAASLSTIKGTSLSEFIGIRLFAGSLFLGDFNASQALLNPLAATEFGQPYITGLPTRFTGYYKYSPGSVFQDRNGNPIAGQTDKCSIYAVVFNGTERLNATNIMTSDRVIARAELADGGAKQQFTRFDIPFVYSPNGVAGKNIMVAIVASSSSRGDEYIGAIGSKLTLDSLRIIPQ
ncbi:PCMD domain-containing protein [Pedobacter nyackensis]|uniref:PCMD domain-containing protein n=1 Tax=Pedobacter nyackensis TaxID=475255 RepID=UPI0029310B58|nr:PCMD domain-containing protein [Pedobacter nyackensis]